MAADYYCLLTKVPANARYSVELSITAPAVPIINDGKTPDLSHFRELIRETMSTAMRAAETRLEKPTTRKKGAIKEAVWDVMEEAYLKASDNGKLRRLPANARQVMYSARPLVAKLIGGEPISSEYFLKVLLPDFIAAHEEKCAACRARRARPRRVPGSRMGGGSRESCRRGRGAMTDLSEAEPVTHRATLTASEQLEYEAAGAGDRRWFAARPGRRYRLRAAAPSEVKVLGGRGFPMTHILTRKVTPDCRLRFGVHWSIGGPTPDDDRVLARLAAGSVFTDRGGQA